MAARLALRRLSVALGTVLFCAAAFFTASVPACAQTLVQLGAKRVTFYYDRFLVEADGGVKVRTSDGMTLTGDAFSMDLKLNRFVLAGHVHAQSPAGAQDGAALADFLDFNRIYFVPITGEPDRWTFLNGDFAHPAKGRQMPGDTFEFPDLSGDSPFLIASAATIGEKNFVRFGGGRVDLANGLGAFIPIPSFYVNFGTDPHMGANSLAGASFDATYQFAGNANAISALHFRYDPVNKTYLSMEQHLSNKNEYAVFSVNPMTRPSKFWDLVTGFTGSDRFQVHTFSQLHTFQYGLSQPLESSQFSIVQLTQALPQSYLQLNTNFTNFNLLAPNATGNYQGHGYIQNHPTSVMLTAQTFDHRIGHLPIFEHINYGYGWNNDSLGLQTLGGVRYDRIYQKTLGFTLFTSAYPIGHSYIQTKNLYLNAIFNKQLVGNSLPHFQQLTDTRVSLSKIYDRHWLSYLQYEVDNVGDYYGAQQLAVYPPFTPVVNGISYPGYRAFRGLATFHTLSLGLNYTNNANFSFSLLGEQHTDFPKPIPFFFPLPPTDFLGNPLPGNFLGRPPYDVTGDMRFRVNSHMAVDVQRTYYFNYQNMRWSPQFVIQVTQ